MISKIEGVEMITIEGIENDQNFQNFEGLEKKMGLKSVSQVRLRGVDLEASEFETCATPQTWRGSFSAVSTPIFASRYSFCCICRDLQD